MAAFYPYPTEMYYTTYVHKSFPEHHYPLEHSRHRLGGFLKSFKDEQTFRVPTADIRETTTNFFIDVELPGLDNEKELKLSWTNSRTLLLVATFTQPPLSADDFLPGTEPTPGTNVAEDVDNQAVAHGETDKSTVTENVNAVHTTAHERWQGRVVRAFNFPVDVDRSALNAHLRSGLLRIMVPKIENSQAVDGKISLG